MANMTRLKVITPDAKLYDADAELVIVRAIDGDIGVKYNHIPTVIPLGIGALRAKTNGKQQLFAIAGGFMKIGRTEVVIIADSCERPEDIDLSRAEQAKLRAEERIKERSPEIDLDRAEISLRRAINRISISNENRYS